jgi:sulfopyruvate decarboxylase subunit alpha
VGKQSPEPEAPAREMTILTGAKIIDAVKRAGVSHVLSVPDLHTAKGLLTPIRSDPSLTLIRTCKEDETLGIAAGLTYGDKRALILIQYTGFLYAMNAIRAMACEHKLPICMMIGLLGKEPDVAPQDSAKFGVRILEPILDVLGIKRFLIDGDEDIDGITAAIEHAYSASEPVAFLIGRKPV